MSSPSKRNFCKICNKNYVHLAPHIKAVHDNVRDHICPRCGKGFPNSCKLQRHSLTHLDKADRPELPKPWNCESCPKSFTTKTCLLSHNQSMHLGLRPFHCELCPAQFKTPGSKRSHLVRIHTRERPHPCPHPGCGKSFTALGVLKQHGQMHSVSAQDRAIHPCSQCEKRFIDKRSLTKHVSVVHEHSGLFCRNPGCSSASTPFPSKRELFTHVWAAHRDSPRFECFGRGGKCQEKFKTKESLISHLITSHEEEGGESWLKCPLCRVTPSSSLKDHLSSAHPDRGRSQGYRKIRPLLHCDKCSKTFLHKISLKYHVASKHEKSDKIPWFDCTQCEKRYRSERHLNRHWRECHSQDGERPRVPCPLCPATLGSKDGLFQHLTTHTGERPYKCGDCARSFTSGGYLRMHKVKMHPINDTSVECPTCGVLFRNKYNLQDHIKLTHVAMMEKKFTCYFCHNRFPTLSRVKLHMVLHTREKVYKCQLCPRKFYRPTGLDVHKIQHRGIKRHVCYFCGESFFLLAGLKYHIMFHTREKILHKKGI